MSERGVAHPESLHAPTVKRSPLPWIGGKHYQAPRIIEALSAVSHQCYIEVFGGAASVLLRKPPSKVEVYNDGDGDLVNFWMQARDNADELQRRLDSLPYSRELFLRWRAEPPPEDPLERAVRFFYRTRSSFASTVGKNVGWKMTVSADCGSLARTFHSAVEMLSAISERLRCVQIDNRDWRDVLAPYDRPGSLFYLDPPYVQEGAACYRNGAWSHDDHRELAARLNAIQGFAAVSYYPHPVVDEAYAVWRRIEYEHQQYGNNALVANRRKHTEVLLLNYDEAGRRLPTARP